MEPWRNSQWSGDISESLPDSARTQEYLLLADTNSPPYSMAASPVNAGETKTSGSSAGNQPNPPNHSRDQTDKQPLTPVIGLTVEIAKEVCLRLGLKCNTKNLPADEHFEQLKGDNVLLSVMPLRVDAQTVQTFHLTRRILDQTAVMLVRTPKHGKIAASVSIPSWLHVHNGGGGSDGGGGGGSDDAVRIGVEAQSTFTPLLRQTLSHISVPRAVNAVEVESALQGLSDLAAGKLDAMFLDRRLAMLWLNAAEGHNCCHMLASNIRNVEALGSGVGFAVARKQKPLLPYLNRAISSMLCDGTMRSIEQRWLSPNSQRAATPADT